jgi:membrane-associated phospholipid phosphatase
MAYRLVDSAIVPSLVWQSPGVAFQMSMIDLESFGLVALTLWGNEALFGRERPLVKRCGDPKFAASEGACNPDGQEHNRSFYAGHPAVVLTAAGLTCTHHSHLPLYGGGAADTLACGTMVGAAVITGAGRLVTEKHHASDVLVGYAMGGVAGWLLPWLLHYRTRSATAAHVARPSAPKVALKMTPIVSQRDWGLAIDGSF